MESSRRSNLAVGLVLVLVGALWLVGQFVPGLRFWAVLGTWPLIIVGVGLLLLIIGAVTRQPEMTIPACIVGGIGLLLFWQNSTGNWGSWAYAWALIPGFAGVGTVLAGLWSGSGKQVRDGGVTILFSLVLFGVFGSFLGGPRVLGRFWPILLILLGLFTLARTLLGTGGEKTLEEGHDAQQ